MASGFSGGNGVPEFYSVGDGVPEFYGVDGRSMSGGSGTVINVGNNNPQYRNQIPGFFLDQIGNRAVSGSHGIAGKRTLADFQAAQLHQSFHNQAAINAFLLRSVKSRSFQNLQSETIDLTNVNDMSLFGGSSQRYLRSQSDFGGVRLGYGSDSPLSGVPCIEPVKNLNRVQESENILNSLRELEKKLLDDDDENDAQGGDDDVSVITNSNNDWLNSLLIPVSNSNLNRNPVLSSSSPSSSSSSSSQSTASTTSVLCSRQTVMEIATAISEGKTEIASEILARVSQTPNQKRNSEEKLVDFMVTALKSRINPAESSVSKLYGKEHLISTQLLYELSPCFKLGFMAANLAILDAASNNNDEETIHVIDFDIGEGGQYVNLLHAISTRRNCNKPPLVKITAVENNNNNGFAVTGDDVEERLKSVGDMLNQLSNRLGISLIFNVVSNPKLSDLNRESLKCDPNDSLSINLAFKLYHIPDESVSTENPRDELLRRVKKLNPRVVTLVEQELNTNTAPFLTRVNSSFTTYSALLDSVESTVPNSNPDRVKVEEGIRRKVINTIACEGLDRIERCEVFGKWRMRMSMAGFELMAVSEKIAESMKRRISNGNGVHKGFTVKEDNGGVCFGWMGRTLAVASAWR